MKRPHTKATEHQGGGSSLAWMFVEQTHQALVCLPCTSYSQERNKLLAVKVLLMVGFFELVFFGYNTGTSILNDTDMKHKFITILLDRDCFAPLQSYHQLGGLDRQAEVK